MGFVAPLDLSSRC